MPFGPGQGLTVGSTRPIAERTGTTAIETRLMIRLLLCVVLGLLGVCTCELPMQANRWSITIYTHTHITAGRRRLFILGRGFV